MRRKFHDAHPSWPQTKEMLVFIRDLYRVEAEVQDLVGEERRRRLGELRHARSKPIAAAIGMWLACEPALPRQLSPD